MYGGRARLRVAVWLRRSVFGGVPLAAGKIANECLVVAPLVALGVPSGGRSRVGSSRGRSRRTAPRARRGAKRRFNLTIAKIISRFFVWINYIWVKRRFFMLSFFYPLVVLSLALLFFEVCAISRALWRLEKTQKRISEDLQMLINFYLTREK